MSVKREDNERWTREQLLRAFRQTPPEFSSGLRDTLRRLENEQEEIVVRRKMKYAPVLVLILMLIAGVAMAAVLSPRTAERFGQFYGETFQERLEQGDTADVGLSLTLGEVTYTVTDVIWSDGVLYGTVVMAPAEGANVVLIPQDADVNDPAGYNLMYGETAPEGAKSYKELAQERGARMVLAKCVQGGYVLGGELMSGDVGYMDTVTTEGTIVSSFELYGWNGGIERAPVYTLRMNLSNWEVTAEGEWLREEPENTWLKAEWNVQVEPVMRQTVEETSVPESVSAEGMEIVMPEGYDGILPSYAVIARDFREVFEAEWLDVSGVAQENHGENEDAYIFADEDQLVVDREGNIWFSVYDGMEEIEIVYADTDASETYTIPHAELSEYLAGLAFWARFETDLGFCYEQPEEAADLSAVTLADARAELEGLLVQLGIEDAQMVYAGAMDMPLATMLSDARNAEIEAGRLLNCNPYDLSNMTEQDEGYALVYTAQVNGVPAEDEYMEIRAFVNADGICSLTIHAPFALAEAGESAPLIDAQEALSIAVQAARKSRIPELAEKFEQAVRAELAYSVRDKARLVPAWRIYANDSDDAKDVWMMAAC